ncbi:hypothetical protein [Streptomyces sp. H39-C1]|uniref:hypothetical protein n=1 Tax=Streptomyces sp. H39-C1 TaxID=3004355 RepID=UPI0022AFE548|nr:hypothetical protein [Streptomyces sp. H39-C1]MCZ4101068.1 hypothetical protein [Streptomyces sp. H39-C1]
MSDTFWVALGSIGATAGFFAIAWQAYLARADGKVNRLIAADTIRARLDSQAPTVRVTLSPPTWPPLSAPSMGGMPVSAWPHDQLWHFPAQQDGSNRIYLQQQLTVTNASDRRVQIQFDGDLIKAGTDGRTYPAGKFILEPESEGVEVHLQKHFTIKELSENYFARQDDQELPHRVTGTVTVDDDRDNGSTDQWDLVLTGCPVEPVEDRDGLWRVALPHLTEGSGLRTLDFQVLAPRRRTHWISRTKNIPLPSPEIGNLLRG